MNIFKKKEILITGGTGLIGRKLVKLLLEKDAKITVASLDDPIDLKNLGINFIKTDLRYLDNCIKCTLNKQIVFHLAGVKGSPKMCSEKPASFLTPTISFSFNMLEAARLNKVRDYLFTSSVGVYAPSKKFYEKDVWKTFPSTNDWYAGWAKRLCELQLEAYKKQYNWSNLYIVRPANVYGPYDNFDLKNAMVIPSMIRKFFENKNKEITFWGDGSVIRDFIFSEDVARGMISVVENKYNDPINLGSGVGYSIFELAHTIKKILKSDVKIKWESNKFSGDAKRLMDISNYKKINFKVKFSLEKGLRETIQWFKKNYKTIESYRYNSFTEFEK
jgi:GDP-L-fucose synthase